MIINIQKNGKILQNKFNISLPDFTILTGENGSGKTQLLEYLRDNSGGFYIDQNQMGLQTTETEAKIIYSITTDDSTALSDIVYSFPGVKNYENDFVSETPLIQQIRDQWNILNPIAKSYSLISEKKFNSEQEELNALNAAIIQFVQYLTVDNSRFSSSNLKKAAAHQLSQLKKIGTQANKSVHELTFIDFLIFYSVPTQVFSSALDLLFHQFHLKQKYYKDLTLNVSPPWDVFNNILENADFKYKVEYVPSQNEDFPPPVKFIDKEKGVSNATVNSLSSGEKTIMALIFVLYHASSNGKFPEVILFDEPDAHLHPSLTQMFLSVIQEVLVNKQKVKVILTTHSPSTIALAPEASVYRMDRLLGYPLKEDKNKAVQNLSDGLASVIIEEGSLGIQFTVKDTNKSVLFTEGITDKIILQIAWKKLYKDKEIPFLIQDCFGASFLSNLFKNGNQKYDGIFEIASDKIMIALFDFDQGGYNAWNGIKFPNVVESDPTKCLTMSNNKNGYTMLLPVPDIAEIKSQVIKIGSETFKDKSQLTIESLLFNVPGFKEKFFSEDKLPGGGSSFQFKGDKREFAKNLEALEPNSFKEFIPLFDKVKCIISHI